MTNPAADGRAGQRLAARLAGSPVFWIGLIAALFAWPVVRAWRSQARLPPPRPVLGTVADFTLTDQYGHHFGTEQLRGKVWVAQFLRSSSPDARTDEMYELQHHTRALGESFHLVSIAIDPAADSRVVLARYAKKHRASRRAWTFLTGPPDRVASALKRGFGIDLARPASAPPYRFALVDRQLRLRGFYDLRRPGAHGRLLRDAGLLVNRGE